MSTSARSAIIPIANGPVGATNPARQGLNSALRGEGDPLNINQGVPGQGNGRYRPIWEVRTNASAPQNAREQGVLARTGGRFCHAVRGR